MSNEPPIATPQETVAEFFKEEALKGPTSQEAHLKALFSKTPLNTNLEDVLAKVAALNDFYGTHISSPAAIAKHIVSLDLDIPLSKGNPKIVNTIAENFYSFATRYCNHHNPLEYPVYDTSVEKILIHFRNQDKFCDFSRQNLKEYVRYKTILVNFRKFYDLESFDLNQISQYLCHAGKFRP